MCGDAVCGSTMRMSARNMTNRLTGNLSDNRVGARSNCAYIELASAEYSYCSCRPIQLGHVHSRIWCPGMQVPVPAIHQWTLQQLACNRQHRAVQIVIVLHPRSLSFDTKHMRAPCNCAPPRDKALTEGLMHPMHSPRTTRADTPKRSTPLACSCPLHTAGRYLVHPTLCQCMTPCSSQALNTALAWAPVAHSPALHWHQTCTTTFPLDL